MSSAPALLGREYARTVLSTALEQAHAGRGSLVLVSGEPGIGKTALAAWVAGQSPMATTAWGRAVEGRGSPAYWIWTQVLRALGRLADGEHLGSGDVDDRFALFEYVVAALDDASRAGGLLVVLDDLQWADLDSVALLGLVSRSLAARRIAVLGTYRDTEDDGVLTGLAREVVPLDGLPLNVTRQLLQQLVGTDIPDSEARRMQQRTGGNPFFIGELARLAQLRIESGLSRDSVGLVESVRDVVERRLARLSQPCARMLTTAALDGGALRPWLLAAVNGEADISGLLGEAVGERVLTEDSRELRFAHDLFREVIVDGLPPTRRRTVHRALARALAAARGAGRGVRAAEIARHFAAAAELGDTDTAREAIRYAREAAGESTARFAFDDAVAQLDGALVALDATGAYPGPRLELLLELAAAQATAGRSPLAAATYREAWSVAGEVGDPAARARAALGLHQIGIKTGPSAERDACAAMLETALAEADPADSGLRLELRAALARTLYHSLDRSRMDRARALATANVVSAREAADPPKLAAALRVLHDVTWAPGTAAQRLAILDELDGHGLRDTQLRLLRSQALLELGDPESRALLAEVCAEADLAGRPGSRWLAASRRAALAILAGRIEEAAGRITEAERIARQIEDDDARWVADIQRWELARDTGGRASYVRHRPDGEPKVEQWAPWHSLVLADGGQDEKATAALAGFTVQEASGPGVNAGYDLWFPAIAAEAAARHGSDRLRADLYDLLAPYAGTQVGCGAWVVYGGPVDGYLADLASALKDPARAAAHRQRAAEQCRRLQAPLWLARVRREPGDQVDTFALSGTVWTVRYAGVEALVPDAKGLHDLAVLLAHPHQAVAAATLAGAPSPDHGEPVLDRRAVTSYRARLTELEQEIEEATADNDIDRTSRASSERETLLAELRRTMGRGGRVRRMGDDSERVRKAVRARLHRALLVLAEYHPQLADHLRASLETGTWCSYRPSEPTNWRVVR